MKPERRRTSPIRRARFHLDRVMRQLNLTEEHVQRLVTRMYTHGHLTAGPDIPDAERRRWQQERERGRFCQKRLCDLKPAELIKVIVALKRSEARQARPARVYKLDRLRRCYKEQ